MSIELWDYIHILLFVFWLGADVGVFVALLYVKNSALGFETRAAALEAAQIIDYFPRVCFALFLPIGLQLCNATGIYPITAPFLAGGWIAGIGWIAVIFIINANRGKPAADILGHIQIAFQAIIGLIFTAIGLNSLATDAPIYQPWFAVKFLLFGLVYWTAIAIDLGFRPFLNPFLEIGQNGSTPEREEAVSRAVNYTLAASVIIYVLIAVIGFLGKVKPV